MDRTVLLLLLALPLAGCASSGPGGPGPAPDTDLPDSFEDGLTGWTIGHDVPRDPDSGETGYWQVNISDERAHTGDRSVRMSVTGRYDDGTVWIVRPVDVEAGRRYVAEFEVQAWSGGRGTQSDLVALLARDPPREETDFPEHETNSTGRDWDHGGMREPLNRRRGWVRYSFTWETPTLPADRLHLAVGVTVTWETRIVHHLDDVDLRMTPV